MQTHTKVVVANLFLLFTEVYISEPVLRVKEFDWYLHIKYRVHSSIQASTLLIPLLLIVHEFSPSRIWCFSLDIHHGQKGAVLLLCVTPQFCHTFAWSLYTKPSIWNIAWQRQPKSAPLVNNGAERPPKILFSIRRSCISNIVSVTGKPCPVGMR